MKRLLILMLVLGLTSMANAVTIPITEWMSATIYEADGTTEWDGSPICPSTDLIIRWYSTSAQGAYVCWVGGVYMEPPTKTCGHLRGGWASNPTPAGNLSRLEPYEDADYQGYSLIADDTAGGPNANQGPGLWFEVWFHCDLEDCDAEIGFYDTGYVYIDSVFIEQIPEPASALLLGLGSIVLALRRRCK